MTTLKTDALEARERRLDDAALAKGFVVSKAQSVKQDGRYIIVGSPIGRLASLPLGADFTLRIAGETVEVEVVERAELHPDFDARGGKS